MPELPDLLQQRLGGRAHLPAVQGQRCLAQRFVRDIEPAMIDPRQGPLFHLERGEQPVAILKTKLVSFTAVDGPELVRRTSIVALAK